MHTFKKRALPPILLCALYVGTTWAVDPSADIQSSTANQFSVSLDVGDSIGSNADWWLVAETGTGFYYYGLTSGWASGIDTVYQGALFNLPTYEVVTSNLPVGTHTIYFGVDTNMNGEINFDSAYYTTVSVEVVAENDTGTDNPETGIGTYPIVDTDQTHCFSDSAVMACGTSHHGQDGQYEGLQPSYQDNDDGTITDLNTGLMWIQSADRTFYYNALTQLETYSFAGYDDWRLPTTKELYSLAQFSGLDASAAESGDDEGLVPFIDTNYFTFSYGDASGGRVIDSQWLTSTVYGSTVMGGSECFFGFNFADGRTKCYGTRANPNAAGFFAQFVRGGSNYGVNNYVDNGDDTVTDKATGLTWTQNDNGSGLKWEEALDYCENLNLANNGNWRLPNIKELHSIVDYSRSPEVTNSAAIDPIFNLTQITNEAGQADYPYVWSSTTLISYPNMVSEATYIAFGRGLGNMEAFGGWIDVHGAGSQRSDDKQAVRSNQLEGFGPQGDARRSSNHVLCVTGGIANPSSGSDPNTLALVEGVTIGGETGASGGEPDLAAAAATLGITEQQLAGALGEPPPDLAAAAATLGITEAELRDALGLP